MSGNRNHVDFKVEKEGWDVYRLEDGTKLKTCNILASVWYTVDDGKKKYSYDIRNTNVLLCDPEMQGKIDSNTHSPQKIMENIEKDPCLYDTISIKPSEYTLEDGTRVVIHSNLMKISRTSLFDASGDRIYSYDLQPSITIIPKIKLYAHN